MKEATISSYQLSNMIALVLTLLLANGCGQSGSQKIPVSTLYGGIKVAGDSSTGAAPKIEIISPNGKTPLKPGEKLLCIIKLDLARNATLPSFVQFKITRGDLTFFEKMPAPKFKGNGVYECSAELTLPKNPGVYSFEAFSWDLARPAGTNSIENLQTVGKTSASKIISIK